MARRSSTRITKKKEETTAPQERPVRKAFFAGSFNPFTKGHADIVERALRVFDKVVIGVGINKDKPRTKPDTSAIEALYAYDARVEVVIYKGLTAEAAIAAGCCALVRGVRSSKDFEYERDLAEVNALIAGIDTVTFYASPALTAVSSSMVRELQSYGIDTSQFLP